MRLNRSIVATLFRTELRMVFRDRRVLVTSIVAPLLLMPVMFAGSRWTIQKRELTLASMTCRYAVTGSQADAALSLILSNQAAFQTNINPGAAPTNRSANSNQPSPQVRFEKVETTNALAALHQGEIHVLVEGLTAGELEKPRAGSNENHSKRPGRKSRRDPGKAGPKEIPFPGNLAVRLTFRGDRDDSVACMNRLFELMQKTRERERAGLLEKAGLEIQLENLGRITPVDLASKRQVAGLSLGRALTLMILIFLLTGGAMIATDSLAGEKERGTLETLLTTGASRLEIILSKHLAVIAFGLLVTLIQLVNLLVYVGFKLLPVPTGFAAAVTPGTVLLLLVMFLPIAALVASVLLLVSGCAKSYKEAQLYFFPVFMLGITPAVAPFLPGLTLRSALVLVPVANIAVGVREVLTGSFDWPMLLLAWLVTAGAAVWTTHAGIRLFQAERLVTAADTDRAEFEGGLALFGRHLWRWFAILWAVLLMVNNYFEKVDLRVQLLVNLVVIFFGGSVLMLWKYRLPLRETLALRLPPAPAWLAVVIGVPGGMLTAVGFFKLADQFIPVPPKVLESFNESVLAEHIPFAQLLFFLTVMPAIFEEILFRGLLLHGLHRRMSPIALALVVGLAFAAFHMTLFRFVPTAALGVMLAAIVMLTGSIYPAMLWHLLNNLIGVLVARADIPLTELGPAAYLMGAGLLTIAFWIAWRHRRPYPGLLQLA